MNGGAGGSNGTSGGSGSSYNGVTRPGGAGTGIPLSRDLVSLGITAGRGEQSCGPCNGGGGGGVLVLGSGPDRESSRAAQGFGAGGGEGDYSGADGVVIIWPSE